MMFTIKLYTSNTCNLCHIICTLIKLGLSFFFLRVIVEKIISVVWQYNTVQWKHRADKSFWDSRRFQRAGNSWAFLFWALKKEWSLPSRKQKMAGHASPRTRKSCEGLKYSRRAVMTSLSAPGYRILYTHHLHYWLARHPGPISRYLVHSLCNSKGAWKNLAALVECSQRSLK